MRYWIDFYLETAVEEFYGEENTPTEENVKY